jgi:hypothetical protein
MQSQRTSPKRAVKKIHFFKLQNLFFFIFLHFDLSTLKPHNFFISLNCYRSTTWSFTNHLGTLIATHKRNFCAVLELAFVMFHYYFFQFMTLFTLRGHNFLNFISFLTIFNAPDASIGEAQLLFAHQKQQSLPLLSGLPWILKCLITNRFIL